MAIFSAASLAMLCSYCYIAQDVQRCINHMLIPMVRQTQEKYDSVSEDRIYIWQFIVST